MQYLKKLSELEQVKDDAVRNSIQLHMMTLSQQYDEPYQATLHGWFVICESNEDLIQKFQDLSFSLSEKLALGEVEFVEKKQDWY